MRAATGRSHTDALVVLDTRGRRLQGVGHREVLLAAGARGCVGEDQQAVRRTTHARRQVVQPEETLEPGRILLVLLERLDEPELLVDQRGVAARQGHEHVTDLGPQLGLTGRQSHRLPVQVVDGPGQLAHFLVRRDVDRHDPAGVLTGADLRDRLGEPSRGRRPWRPRAPAEWG